MIYLNELRDMIMYKKEFYAPIDLNDKLHNSLIYLMSPSQTASFNTIKHPLMNTKTFYSYYIEKGVNLLINPDGTIDDTEETNVVTESSLIYKNGNITTAKLERGLAKSNLNYMLTENDVNQVANFIVFGDPDFEVKSDSRHSGIIESVVGEDTILSEGAKEDKLIRNLIYRERLKTPKDVLNIYAKIDETLSMKIRYKFLYLNKYLNRNLFVDLFYYINIYNKNSTFKADKGVKLYLDFMSRLLKDARLNSYIVKTVVIPVYEWIGAVEGDLYDYTQNVNPISTIIRAFRRYFPELQTALGNTNFLFLGKNGYFKCNFSQLDMTNFPKFNMYIKNLSREDYIPEEVPDEMIKNSKQDIVDNIVNSVEKNISVKINNLTGNGEDITTDKILDRINKAAVSSTDVNTAAEELDKDKNFKELLLKLADKKSEGININDARRKRLNVLSNEFEEKEINGIKIKDMLYSERPEERIKELPSRKVKTTSVNKEWEDMKYINFEETYDIKADILEFPKMLSEASYPIATKNINIENTSTSEDYIDTYKFDFEDSQGKRFSVKLDIPKFKDDKFMLLKGNDKTIAKQFAALPIIKTDVDTVQITTNTYNKIFIRRFGNKCSPMTDKMVKALMKIEDTNIKSTFRACYIINNANFIFDYEFLELSKNLYRVDTPKYDIFINQMELRKIYEKYLDPESEAEGLVPIAFDKVNKKLIYIATEMVVFQIHTLLQESSTEYSDAYEKATISKTYMYANASILNTKMPVIVMLAYSFGLLEVFKRANIEYSIEEKRPNYNKITQDIIKFEDGWILYTKDTPEKALLTSGLNKCSFLDDSLEDINSKILWLSKLDYFGNRVKLSDGLDNFCDFMIDPITKQVLEDYKLPTDYLGVILYATGLLSDNKMIKDVSSFGRRIRSNELVAGYAYKVLAEAYGRYKQEAKRGRKDAIMSLKQTAVLDQILTSPTCSDASALNALQDAEMINSISYKGLTGNNSDRGFNAEKRAYDPSMINVLGLSTNFAGNVGIARQTTIDPNIYGVRGYIRPAKDLDTEMNITKALTVTEGLSPFTATNDDPMRVAMNFIQTAKHQVRTKKALPCLISNGTDEALPQLTSNTFSFKAKKDGVITKKTKDYMIVKYDDGSGDFVDLRSIIKKNSAGGFFIPLQQVTDLTVGQRFEARDVLSYDPYSFTKNTGMDDTLAYACAPMVKAALMSTDDGFEDSGKCSYWLSDALTTNIVMKKEIVLKKSDIILKVAKKGQQIEEGDSILTFQNSYDQEDVNILLKLLSGSDDEVNEVGKMPLKSKYTGRIEDIKIYRTVELDELSESLRKFVESIEKPVEAIKKEMNAAGIDYANTLEPTYALPSTGKLKAVDEGILVEMYICVENTFGISDKGVFQHSNKFVNRGFYPLGDEPYSEYRKDEKIHTVAALGGVNGRMITSIITVGCLNKLCIELDRHCKEILGIPWQYLEEIQK